MTVGHIEVIVEEPSIEAAFQLLLPKIVGQLPFRLHPHNGKRALLESLPGRLRGYAAWMPNDWRILVVVDRDNQDCEELKAELQQAATDAGLNTRRDSKVVNRIAIEELEAWYFGDWDAVRTAYPRVPENIPKKAPFRNSDSVEGGTWEAFERILQKSGYFSGGLRKIEAARAIAAHMIPDRNSSCSFKALVAALKAWTVPT